MTLADPTSSPGAPEGEQSSKPGSTTPTAATAVTPANALAPAYATFWQHIMSACPEMPNLTISCKELAVEHTIEIDPAAEKKQGDQTIPTLAHTVVSKIRGLDPRTWTASQKKNVHSLSSASVLLNPGEMTLILSPPGHGKTTLLRAMAGRLHDHKGKSSLTRSGRVSNESHLRWNGMTAAEMAAAGMNIAKLTAFVEQTDVHYPLLSVRETFRFALDASLGDVALLQKPEIVQAKEQLVEAVIQTLGLSECADTNVGSADVRGVSGGQRRRVSVGEMLLGCPRAVFLDEVTSGLDASTAYQLVCAMKQWACLAKAPVCMALLQPTPQMVDTFDKIVLMLEGKVVFTGTPNELREHWTAMYIPLPPKGESLAEWSVKLLAEPVNFVRQAEKLNKIRRGNQLRKYQSGTKNLSPQLNAHHSVPKVEQALANQTVRFHIDAEAEGGGALSQPKTLVFAPVVPAPEMLHDDSTDETSTKGAVRPDSLTPEGMLADWEGSPFYHKLISDIDAVHATGKSNVQALAQSHHSAFMKNQFYSSSTLSFGGQCRLLIDREFKAVMRNEDVFYYRLIQAILMGLVIGSLFFDLGSESKDASLRLSLIYLSIIIIAFGGMSEVPAMIQFKQVVLKHTEAGFFSELPYMISAAVSALPVAILEAILLDTLVYWMCGFNKDAGRFFFFLLLQFLTGLALFAFFRVVAFMVQSADVAIAVVSPVTGIAIMFGGFLITRKKIADWLIWCYWANPFTWAFNSLALNEFESDDYKMMDLDGETMGEKFLRTYQISTDSRAKWGGVGFLVVFFLVSSIVASILLLTAKGKRTGHHNTTAGAIKENPGEQETLIEMKEVQPVQDGAELPFEKIALTFTDVSYFVEVPADDSSVAAQAKEAKGRTVQKRLLNNVTGYAKPGSITALMGSSGAGKTTLLDVLAQRKSTGKVSGSVMLKGVAVSNAAQTGRVLAYCEQADHHFLLSTVEESLAFSARLRLETSVTDSQRKAFVKHILRELEMESMANRLVSTLTPGERKRLTIGVELASNSPILFLDEPTTGLDARSAVVVMRAVQRIAQSGRTVICTIHQPSKEVFLFFDRLLLLQSGGNCVYFGDVGENGQTIVDHFTSLKMPPPHPQVVEPEEGVEDPSCNVAVWMLQVVQPGGIEDASSEALSEPPPYAALYKTSPLCEKNKAVQTELEVVKQGKGIGHQTMSDYAQPFSVQFPAVLHRLTMQQWRAGDFQFAKLVPCFILGLVLGIIFYNIDDDDAAGMQSKLSSLFSAVMFAAMTIAAGCVPPFFSMREAFYRETTSLTYMPLAHALSFLIVELPYIVIGVILMSVPFYWMVGLRAHAGTFFYFLVVVFAISVVFSVLNQCFCSISPNAVITVMFSDLFVTFAFLFAGLFVPKDNIPKGWIWFYYINPLPKGLMGVSLPQWPCSDADGSGAGCEIVTLLTGTMTKKNYVQDFVGGVDGWQYYNLAYLLLTIIVLQMAFVAAVCKVSYRSR